MRTHGRVQEESDYPTSLPLVFLLSFSIIACSISLFLLSIPAFFCFSQVASVPTHSPFWFPHLPPSVSLLCLFFSSPLQLYFYVLPILSFIQALCSSTFIFPIILCLLTCHLLPVQHSPSHSPLCRRSACPPISPIIKSLFPYPFSYNWLSAHLLTSPTISAALLSYCLLICGAHSPAPPQVMKCLHASPIIIGTSCDPLTLQFKALSFVGLLVAPQMTHGLCLHKECSCWGKDSPKIFYAFQIFLQTQGDSLLNPAFHQWGPNPRNSYPPMSGHLAVGYISRTRCKQLSCDARGYSSF